MSRIILEDLLNKIWKEIIKWSVSISCFYNFLPNTAQKLNCVVWVLKKENKNDIIEILNIFIWKSVYYSYLNSNSHNDESLEDVSPSEANEIFEALIKLKDFKK